MSPDRLAAARASLDRAQALLDRVEADNARLDEVLGWLDEAVSRAALLSDYYHGPGVDDVEAVLGAQPLAATPPVANEDAAWNALADHDERMLRLLRAVTISLTARLDVEEVDLHTESDLDLAAGDLGPYAPDDLDPL